MVSDYYSIEMFNDSELLNCLNDRIVESSKYSYNYAICDSDVEYEFAMKFEERLYFVVETKGKSDISLIREEKRPKILCARKYFKALKTKVEFKGSESSADEFMEKTKGVLE